MRTTAKFGIITFIMIMLASSVLAVLPPDLTFDTNLATATVGEPFTARLVISPTGGPMDPFDGYLDANITLPGGLTASEAWDQDISNHPSDTLLWNLNSSADATYTINITVNSTYTGSASITINAPVTSPELAISITDVTDNQIVGQPATVQVQFDNTAGIGGDATEVNGYLTAQGAVLNASTFSLPSLTAAGSQTRFFELTPTSFGNLSLTANYSNYKKSDSTLVSVGDADFNATGDIDYFYTVASPVVALPASIEVTTSTPHDSIDLDDIVTDADTALVDLALSCNTTDSRISVSVDASNVLSVSTTNTSEFMTSVDCFAFDGVATGTDNMSVSVNPAAPPAPPTPPSSPPSSPSSGGGLPSTVSKSFAWSLLEAGDSAAVVLKDKVIKVTDIEFTVLTDLTDVEVRVKEVDSLPSAIEEPLKTYQILFFEKTNLADEDIGSATIKFAVEKAWLTSEDLANEDIVLKRYHDNEWQELETKILSTDAVNVYYSASTPGFSYFIIGAKSDLLQLGEKEEDEEIAEETEGELGDLGGETAEEEETVSETEETVEEESEAEEKDFGWVKYVIGTLIVLALISLIVLLVLKLSNGKEKSKKPKKRSKFWSKVVDYFMEEDAAPVKKKRK